MCVTAPTSLQKTAVYMGKYKLAHDTVPGASLQTHQVHICRLTSNDLTPSEKAKKLDDVGSSPHNTEVKAQLLWRAALTQQVLGSGTSPRRNARQPYTALLQGNRRAICHSQKDVDQHIPYLHSQIRRVTWTSQIKA